MMILAFLESGSRSIDSILSGFMSIQDPKHCLKQKKNKDLLMTFCLNMTVNVADTTAETYSLLDGAAAATIRFSRQGSSPSPARPRSTRGQFFCKKASLSAAIAGSDAVCVIPCLSTVVPRVRTAIWHSHSESGS
jgi:hypothetical protein